MRSEETALHKPLPSSWQSDHRCGRGAVCQVSSHLAAAATDEKWGIVRNPHTHPVNIRDILQVSSILVNSDWCIVHTPSTTCSCKLVAAAIFLKMSSMSLALLSWKHALPRHNGPRLLRLELSDFGCKLGHQVVSLALVALSASSVGIGVREDIKSKSTFSFGHCPN